MFQHRQWPEGFEFPACEPCNRGTSDSDLLVAMIARMDPIEGNGNRDGKTEGLIRMVNKQHPGLISKMMPSSSEARRMNRDIGLKLQSGQTHQEAGIVKVPEEIHNAVSELARKLSKGIFYRETGSPFPDEGCLILNWFTNEELFREGKYITFDLLKEIAGTAPQTQRSGKYLNDQFEYKLSLSNEREFFVLQARFSNAFGLAVFGSTQPNRLEAMVSRLREKTSRNGPFAILQSTSLM